MKYLGLRVKHRRLTWAGGSRGPGALARNPGARLRRHRWIQSATAGGSATTTGEYEAIVNIQYFLVSQKDMDPRYGL